MMTDSALCDKIKEILFSTKMVDEIDQLRPNDTYAVNVSTPEFLDLFLEDSARFSEQFRNAVLRILQQRFTGFDVKSTFKKLKIELRSSDNYITKMHDIDSTFENRTVIFDAVIIAADIPKTYVVSGTAMCDRCGSEQSVVSGFDRKVWMPSCANHSCRGGKMTLKPSNCVTNDIQTVLLQQPLEKAKNSSPVILTGKLIGQNVRTAFIGQNKRITGVFRTQFDSKTEEYHVNIDILSMSSLDMEEEILPSEVEQAELKTKSSKDDFIDTVVNSFAPDIYGYKDIKLSILLYLVGGVSVRKRGDINMLLVGDPSMAKSELLKFGKKLTQRSIYTSGRGTTGAGLTIGMVKLSDGRMVAQAGVLPLCSGGYAFIDEFDKMNKEDRASMHEAMEQQTVSIAKAGTVLTLPSKTSILAAANPKYGSYDSTMTLRDNIDVPAPLLSRFDMVWLIKDKVNVTEDMMKAQHILDTFDFRSKQRLFLRC
jgi:replicative DNA helicase Mcm